MAKKKTTKKNTKEKRLDGKVFLSHDQIFSIEDARNKELIGAKDLNIASLKYKVSSLELENLKLNVKLKESELSDLESKGRESMEKYNYLKESSKKIIEEVRGQMDLKEKWGYDPITGEVKNE